ncbi:MAG TPA: PQQ-binding-like beta-propeller repeat protein, partial [Polyangiaceae bacterium]
MSSRRMRLALAAGLASLTTGTAMVACGGRTAGGAAGGGGGSPLDAASDAGTSGALDASVDARTTSDGSLDAFADALPDVHAGAIVLPCGAAAGVQPGSPWPMAGRCPQRNAHTDAIGSTAPSGVRTLGDGGLSGDFVIAADGTVYSFAGPDLVAIGPDGGTRWSTPVPTDPGVQRPSYIPPGTTVMWLAIGADGTVYAWDGDLTAFTPAGAIAWSLDITSYPARPQYECLKLDLDPAGNVLVADTPPDAGSTLHAVAPSGTTAWEKTLPTGTTIVSSPTVGIDGAIYFIVVDATGAFSLQALDSSGNETWNTPLGTGDSAGFLDFPPVVSEDGTVIAFYVGQETTTGFRAFTPDGGVLSSSSGPQGVLSVTPVAGSDRIYVTAGGQGITAFSTAGATLWTSSPWNPSDPTLVVDGTGNL